MFIILDLAIGAPNAETVYIYKTYPVVRLNVNVTPLTKEIKTTDNSFKMKACWSYTTLHAIDFPIGTFNFATLIHCHCIPFLTNALFLFA